MAEGPKPKYRNQPASKKAGLEPMHVEDVMQRNVLAGFRRDPPAGGVPAHQRAGGRDDKARIDDTDLIASMAKRLSALEKSLKESNAQLTRSQAEHDALKGKLRVAEEEIARHAVSAVDSPAAEDSAAVQHLRAENSRLRSKERLAWRQVSEMKQFLAEYGMIWVGDQQHRASEDASGSASSAPSHSGLPKPKHSGNPLTPSKHEQQPPSYGAGAGGASSSSAAATPSSSSGGAQKAASASATPRGVSHSGQQPEHASSSGSGQADAAGHRASGVKSVGTCWDSGSSAQAEAKQGAGGHRNPDHGSIGYGALSGAGGLWAQPPPPRLSAPGAPPSSSVHASMQTPPSEEDLAELTEAATAGAAAGVVPPPQLAQKSAQHSAEQHSAVQQERRHAGGSACNSSNSGLGGGGASSVVQHCSSGAKPQHAQQRVSQQQGDGGGGGHARVSSGVHQQGGGGAGEGGDKSGPLPFKLADVLARVAELNQLAGDGCGQLVPGKGVPLGRVLQTPEPIRCTIFKDGLQLHRSPARPFGDPTVDMVLRDILDGFFPSPLKKDFPDGVPIKVVDHTRESYRDALGPVNAHGSSNKAGGSNVRSFQDLDLEETAPVHRDKFLAKLPVSVIRNGKVVDIRNGIGGLMKGVGQSGSEAGKVALIPSPADALLSTSQRNHVGPVLPPPSREPSAAKLHSASKAASGVVEPGVGASKPEITTLQVKSEDGQQTMIIRLNYDDTIGTLHKCINLHRSKQQGSPWIGSYEVRTAFPAKAYMDLSETLRSASLVPNATVFLRAVHPGA